MFAQRGNRGGESLQVEGTDRGFVEAIGHSFEYKILEGVEFLNHGRVWDQQVTTIGEDGKNGGKQKLHVPLGGEAGASFTKPSDYGKGYLG